MAPEIKRKHLIEFYESSLCLWAVPPPPAPALIWHVQKKDVFTVKGDL